MRFKEIISNVRVMVIYGWKAAWNRSNLFQNYLGGSEESHTTFLLPLTVSKPGFEIYTPMILIVIKLSVYYILYWNQRLITMFRDTALR
jgi:hypothetical protein